MEDKKEDLTADATPGPSLSVAVTVQAATQVNIADTIDVWAGDLVGNFPPLRETDAYNKFRVAVADLKIRLQAV